MVVDAKGFQDRSKKRPQDFTRERKMGFKGLIYFFLNMIKESSQNALERYFDKNGQDTFMSQQAFSLARQKIKWEAFRELYDLTVNASYKNYPDEIKRWNGLRIHATDGSIVLLPSDQPLRTYFGTTGCGNKSAAARASMLYDMLNDVAVDARLEPMEVGERALAEMHISQLAALESFEEWKELILFDRGYPSFELIQGLLERKIHYVMRVREKFSTVIDDLGRGDHGIELERGEERIPVRIIKFRLASGEIETLITDIMDKRYGVKAFKALYFKRWPIETKYDQIKNKLEIENFSGRLVDNIRQDFYATMLLTNVAAEFRRDAQKEVEKERRGKGNKWRYKVNVNHQIGVLKDRLIQTLLIDDHTKRSEQFDKVVKLLEKRVIPIRPNRSLPRTIPRKAKFHHNHKSNC
jgi:hypothetical protein